MDFISTLMSLLIVCFVLKRTPKSANVKLAQTTGFNVSSFTEASCASNLEFCLAKINACPQGIRDSERKTTLKISTKPPLLLLLPKAQWAKQRTR